MTRCEMPTDRSSFKGALSSGKVLIMGVLNVTPDSFSDGGRHLDPECAEKRFFDMVRAGADIIDIGAESSRPGAQPLSEKEELQRLMPVLSRLSGRSEVPISVDTYKSAVAEAALGEGASIINDITALRGDERMAKVIADRKAGVVLMHMKGSPQDMQIAPIYKDLLSEILEYLKGSVELAETAGISPESIIVDPGIGFGKTCDDNLRILGGLGELRGLGKPILIGTSRKSFLGKVTGRPVHDREMATAASVAAGILAGASIVRVHNVSGMRDIVTVTEAIRKAKER